MSKSTFRLYKDLAWLWPVWGGVEEYRAESELFARLIKQYAKTGVSSILDVGCGGGKNAFHLKGHFALTGVDISEDMLALARKLNPDCDFRLGDMRDLNLGRQFDSAFINDSITYMRTKDELLSAFQSAFRHVRSSGVVVTYPDHTKETFVQNETKVSCANAPGKPDNLDVIFIENSYDPDPTDDSYEFTLVCLIREDGRLRIEDDRHVGGVFGLDVWRQSLRTAGFRVHEEGWDEAPGPSEQRLPVFVCVKPA